MIRYPNLFQLAIVLLFAICGAMLGSYSGIDMGHSVWAVMILGGVAGAFLGLLLSGGILMVTNYWHNRRHRDSAES